MMIVSKFRHNYKDLTNLTINRLMFLSDSGERTSSGNVLWLVKCFCGNTFKCRPNRIVRGSTQSCGCFRSQKARERASKYIGINHPNYKHGLSKEHRRKARLEIGYINWRNSVFERDNYTCRKCGQYGGKLIAHHLNGWHWCEEQRSDVDNGATLCNKCHIRFHVIYSRFNNTKQQFEEFLKEE